MQPCPLLQALYACGCACLCSGSQYLFCLSFHAASSKLFCNSDSRLLLCSVCIIHFELLHQHMCYYLLICCGFGDLKKGDFCTTAAVITKSAKVAATSFHKWTPQFHIAWIWSAYLYAYQGFVVFTLWEWSIFSTLAEGSVRLLTFPPRVLSAAPSHSPHTNYANGWICAQKHFWKLRSPGILPLKICSVNQFQLWYCKPPTTISATHQKDDMLLTHAHPWASRQPPMLPAVASPHLHMSCNTM